MSTLEENTQVNEWIRFGLKLGVSSALHPFEYAKVLIQVRFFFIFFFTHFTILTIIKLSNLDWF